MPASHQSLSQLLQSAEGFSEQDSKILLDKQKELIAHLFDRGSTYTTVVIVAGYAGLFTIWGTTNQHLSETQNIMVGVSIGLSLAAFVYYEVYKMYFYTISTFRCGQAFWLPQKEAVKKLLEIEYQERQKLPRMYAVWLFVFLFTIATSAIGVIILLSSLILQLVYPGSANIHP